VGRGKCLMRRNLLVILIDCLRADLCYGERGSAITPVFSRLRQQGTSFNQAITAATFTTPAVASLMTGLYPFAHGIRSLKGHKLSPGCVTLAEILSQNGYQTRALATGPLLPETGLHRGFEDYQYRQGKDHLYTGWRNLLHAELDGLARQHKSWFLFLHLWELHVPRYLLPAFNRAEFGTTRYERSLSCLDREVGEILERLDLEQTVVVLHGDHGERYERSIVERCIRKLKRHLLGWGAGRGWYKLGHGYHVYDFLIRVPLTFVAQGLFPAGVQIDTQVRQIDIMPTILEAMGIPLDREINIHGRSLLPLIDGTPIEELPALIEASGLGNPDPRNRLIGIRIPPWKYVFAPHNPMIAPELYHLGEDPQESKNLVSQHAAIAKELQNSIVATQARSEEEAITPMTREEQEQVEKRLRELGYID